MTKEQMLLETIVHENLKIHHTGKGQIWLKTKFFDTYIDIHDFDIKDVIRLRENIFYYKGKYEISASKPINDNDSQLEGKDYRENLSGQSKE